MITVFLEPKDWVPAKRSLYADKGGGKRHCWQQRYLDGGVLFFSVRKERQRDRVRKDTLRV